MNSFCPYYLHKLREVFSQKQRVNPRYSMRSYARFLEIHSSHLSAIFNEKRALPLKKVEVVAEKLELSPKEKKEFLNSILEKNKKNKKLKITKTNKKVLKEEAAYRIIAEWEHYAVLNLLKLQDFQSCYSWMAARLGIKLSRVKVVVENLIVSEILERNVHGDLQRKTLALDTSDDIASEALKKAHSEHCDLAKEKLYTVDVLKRNYSTVTFSINPKDLAEIKKIIYEFEEKMSQFERKDAQEVYQMGIQLFPLSSIKEKKS